MLNGVAQEVYAVMRRNVSTVLVAMTSKFQNTTKTGGCIMVTVIFDQVCCVVFSSLVVVGA
jgi:hypothetical protein